MKLNVANKRQNTLSVYDSMLAKYGLNRIPGAFQGKPGVISVEVPDKDVDICCQLLKKKAPYLTITKGNVSPIIAATGSTTPEPATRTMAPPPDDRPPGFGSPPATTKTDTKSMSKASETSAADFKEEDPKKKK